MYIVYVISVYSVYVCVLFLMYEYHTIIQNNNNVALNKKPLINSLTRNNIIL